MRSSDQMDEIKAAMKVLESFKQLTIDQKREINGLYMDVKVLPNINRH